MKTTLVLDDSVAARLRREAQRRRTTMSQIVEDALRRYLDARPEKPKLPPLPVHDMGVPLVDIADRDALYDAMEGDEP